MPRTLALCAIGFVTVAGALAACGSDTSTSNGGSSDASAGTSGSDASANGGSANGGGAATAGRGGGSTGGNANGGNANGGTGTGGNANGGNANGGTGGATTDQVDCDGDGTPETTLGTNDNCASCGDVCTVTNGTGSCVAGACTVATCFSGFDDCDGDYSNGCEADLNNSVTTCGSCTKACAVATPLPDAGASTDGGSSADGGAATPAVTDFACVQGLCQITSCPDGYDDCDSDPDNGCETYLSTLSNCGVCGNPCAVDNGTASCAEGTCQVACSDGSANCAASDRLCDLGWGDCNLAGSDGCETPTTTLGSCGACGYACDFANANEACELNAAQDAYVCNYKGCVAGYDDCNGDAPTVADDGDDRSPGAGGCETSLAGSGTPSLINDCGACGNQCDTTNAYNICILTSQDGGVAYTCAVNSCTGDFYDDPNVPGPDCQCQLQPGGSDTCAAATTAFNLVGLGDTKSVSGNIPDLKSDWYLFAFDQDGNAASASNSTGRNSAAARRDGNTSVQHSVTVNITSGYTFKVHQGDSGTACANYSDVTCQGADNSNPLNEYSWTDPCNTSRNNPSANRPANLGVPYKAECRSEQDSAPDLMWIEVQPPNPPTCSLYTLTVVWQ